MLTLTQERLKELLDYNPDTGIFVWKKTNSNRIKIGDEAGSKNSYGYLTIRIDRSLYMAHRLVWLYVYGKLPNCQIDHVNHNCSDNKIINLRDVSRSANLENQIKAKSHNVTGLLGVSFISSRNKFIAQIKINGKKKFLGYFDIASDAHFAYIDAKRIHHTTCTI